MLGKIRNSTGSWLIKFILGVIVIVFVFWGVGSFRSQRLNVLTKVNGEDILMESYRLAHTNMLDNYKRMFGGQIPEGFLDRIDIKQQVLNGLINETLIRQAANEIGILVSDIEIQNIILAIPAFKHNGEQFGLPEYDVEVKDGRITGLHVKRGASCGATWQVIPRMIGVPADEALSTIGREIQYLCKADGSAFDPVSSKSPLHFAGKVHMMALKKAFSIFLQPA